MKSMIGLFVLAITLTGPGSLGPLSAQQSTPLETPPTVPVADPFSSAPAASTDKAAPADNPFGSPAAAPKNKPAPLDPFAVPPSGSDEDSPAVGVFKLKHADAATLAQQITQLYGQQMAVADARTNSLIVHGAIRPYVQNLIKIVDQPAEKSATTASPASPWVGPSDPASVRDISAAIDGVVTSVLVKHGDDVKAGDTLVEMKSSELEASISEITTKLKESQIRLENVQKLFKKNVITQGELAMIENTYVGLRAQLDLLKERQNSLKVASPIDGKVITWNLQEQLISRPVQRGQVLLQLALPTTSQIQVGGLGSSVSLDFPQSKLREEKLRQLVAGYKKRLAQVKNGQGTEQDLAPTKVEIHTTVLDEVTAKHASQVQQLGQMRAKVDRIEQTLVEQEKNRDAIVVRRVEALLSDSSQDTEEVHPGSPAPRFRSPRAPKAKSSKVLGPQEEEEITTPPKTRGRF